VRPRLCALETVGEESGSEPHLACCGSECRQASYKRSDNLLIPFAKCEVLHPWFRNLGLELGDGLARFQLPSASRTAIRQGYFHNLVHLFEEGPLILAPLFPALRPRFCGFALVSAARRVPLVASRPAAPLQAIAAAV
jgi:hypothetical protein